MSSKHIIETLLAAYIDGRLSPEEKNQFFDLLCNSENELVFRQLLSENIYAMAEPQSTTKDPDFTRIYHNIMEKNKIRDIEEAEQRAGNRKYLFRKILVQITAAAAIFVFAFIIARFTMKSETIITEPQASMTVVKAPYGSRSEVSLPDGTSVKLNAGSYISYASDYNRTNRNVTLKGEAYFKVARNEEIPFIVDAGPINVKALGTEFNIKAYDDENTIETTLVTGKVEITQEGAGNENQAVGLNPSQKSIFIRDEQAFLIDGTKESEDQVKPVPNIMANMLIVPEVNVEQVLAWTEGKLILKGESLDKLCVALERKYDMTFVFTGEKVKKFRFTGVLLDETLEQVLNVIRLTAPITYSIEGKVVSLSSDPNSVNTFSRYTK
jgi:ferric-dicitrate binding protein FerR (iron transport regulator)